MEEQKGEYFNNLKKEVVDYLNLRIELFKISSYEKIAKVAASLLTGLILVILLFFAIVFGSLMAGFYFSKLTGSYSIGFAIITGFYFLLFLIIAAFRKQLFNKLIVNKMIEILFENDDKHTH